MHQKEKLDEWINIFEDMYSQDPKILYAANEAVQDKFENDQEFLLDVCTKILIFEDSADDRIMKAKSLSSLIIYQILKIQNNLNALQKDLIQKQELTNQIKNALKQNIFSANESIRNTSIQCYSYLLAILTKYWKDGIDYIVKSFNNTSLLPYGYISLISIMREVINLIQHVYGIVPYFNDQINQTIVFCTDILSKDKREEKYIPELRIEACGFIHDIILMYKEIFDDKGKKAAKIPALLQNLSNSFQIGNAELYKMLNKLLFMIIKQYYPQSPTFINQIKSYVNKGFEFSSVNIEIVNSSILFWKEVATFERNIINKCEIDKKLGSATTTVETLLSETESEKLLQHLFKFIEDADEKDTDVEDIKLNHAPSMYSEVAVAAIYKLFPKVIFNKVSQKIEEIISKAENWTHAHSAVLLIYSIADSPTSDDVCKFISDKFDMLIKFTLPYQVPKLRETALFVIGFAIKNYPQIITKRDTDKRLNDLIDSFEFSLSIDYKIIKNNGRDIILERIISIICNLAIAFKKYIYESRISAYFDKFYEIQKILFNHGISNNDRIMIINSSEALNQLILSVTPDFSSRLGDIYKSTLVYIDQSKTQYSTPDFRFFVQSTFCSNIYYLLLKLKRISRSYNQEIISTYAGRTLELLYELLNNKNVDIYDKGLLAISGLVNATSFPEENYYIELFNQDTFNRLIDDFIYNGLISMNSNVIISSCILIGDLYYFQLQKMPELVAKTPNIFNLLKNTYLENKDMRNMHPFIFKAIADIFNSLDKTEHAFPDLEIDLYDLLKKACDKSNELDITKKADIEYGNLFYKYLTDSFGSYAKIYYSIYDQEKQRDQLFFLDKLATYINKLSPTIDESLYLSFANTAKLFAENCSRRNNVILNRHLVHRILRQGFYYVTTQSSKKRIKEVIDFLKSR